MTTIAEKLTGKSAQEYIPIEKREENIKYRDGAGNSYRVLMFIKDHQGEELTSVEIASQIGAITAMNVSYHIHALIKKGKITKVGGRGEGTIKAKYFLKTLAPTTGLSPAPIQGRVKPGDGPVEIKRPGILPEREPGYMAPSTRSVLSPAQILDERALEYVKTLQGLDDAELGARVKGILGFLESISDKAQREKDLTSQFPSSFEQRDKE